MKRQFFLTLLAFPIFVGAGARVQQSAKAEANEIYKVGGDVSAPVLIHSVMVGLNIEVNFQAS